MSQTPDISLCRIADRIVGIDIVANRYWSTKDHGLLREGGCDEDAPLFCPPQPLPLSSALDHMAGALDALMLSRFLFELASIARQVRGSAIAPVVETIRRQKRQAASMVMGETDIHRWGALVCRANLLVPVNDQCLVRSLALTRLLTRQFGDVSLVFGVKLEPFEAHCWVARGGTILNDRPDHVRSFTPVLVV